MLESGGYADFVEKAFWPESSRELRTEHLECDWAVMAMVVHEVDRRHAALAELTLDTVAVRDCSLQLSDASRQGLARKRRFPMV